MSKMDPNNNVPYIQNDEVTLDIVNKLDPKKDYEALIKLPELTNDENIKDAIFDKLLNSAESAFGNGKIPNALTPDALEYLKITFHSRDGIIDKIIRGQWPLFELIKNLAAKGVTKLSYNIIATIDKLAEEKKILDAELLDKNSWINLANLYKNSNEEDIIYKIKLSIFFEDINNLKRFSVNKD
jgi:hypothetical protein